MKRLLLITLLCVGFAWGSENNASSYPKHWTAEDIEWHKSLGDDGTSIEDAIYICNNGGINGYLNIQACQALKALKNYALYVEAKNKTKAKSSFRELCYWTMRMSEQEMLYFIEIRDNDGYVLMVPSEIKGFKKECAKMK